MGRHRKRSYRRAWMTTVLAAGSVLCGGIGVVLAQPAPALVRVSLSPPVIAEEIAAPAPVQRVPAPVKLYVAREGDSMWSIAFSQCGNGNDWRPLAKANHISYPYPVMPGAAITVECR